MNLGDKDALAVTDYARAHPFEEVDAAPISAEAGNFATSTPAQAGEQPPVFAERTDDAPVSAPTKQSSGSGMQQDASSAPFHVQSSGKRSTFFPSNAFMASARSLHTFNRSKKMNCNYHARLSTCR